MGHIFQKRNCLTGFDKTGFDKTVEKAYSIRLNVV